MNKIKLDEMKKKIQQGEKLQEKINKLQVVIDQVKGGTKPALSIVIWVGDKGHNLNDILEDDTELTLMVIKRLKVALTELQAKYEAI